jgi:hypothetical protein
MLDDSNYKVFDDYAADLKRRRLAEAPQAQSTAVAPLFDYSIGTE